MGIIICPDGFIWFPTRRTSYLWVHLDPPSLWISFAYWSMAISGTDWLEVPTIYKAYCSGLCKGIYPQFIWPYMVLTYLYFRFLNFPLNWCPLFESRHPNFDRWNDHHFSFGGMVVTIWLWLTVRHGKIHPFLRTVNHLFLWAIYTMANC